MTELLVEMHIGIAIMKNNTNTPQNLRLELPYDPVIPLLGMHTKGTKSRIKMIICTPRVHYSITYSSSDMEITQVSVNGSTAEEKVTLRYNGVLFNCEKEGNATLYDNLDELGGHHAE